MNKRKLALAGSIVWAFFELVTLIYASVSKHFGVTAHRTASGVEISVYVGDILQIVIFTLVAGAFGAVVGLAFSVLCRIMPAGSLYLKGALFHGAVAVILSLFAGVRPGVSFVFAVCLSIGLMLGLLFVWLYTRFCRQSEVAHQTEPSAGGNAASPRASA
jgi:hypothetical protein